MDTRTKPTEAAVEPPLKPATIRSPFSHAMAEGLLPMNSGFVASEVEFRSTVFNNLNCGPEAGGALIVKLPDRPGPVLLLLYAAT